LGGCREQDGLICVEGKPSCSSGVRRPGGQGGVPLQVDGHQKCPPRLLLLVVDSRCSWAFCNGDGVRCAMGMAKDPVLCSYATHTKSQTKTGIITKRKTNIHKIGKNDKHQQNLENPETRRREVMDGAIVLARCGRSLVWR